MYKPEYYHIHPVVKLKLGIFLKDFLASVGGLVLEANQAGGTIKLRDLTVISCACVLAEGDQSALVVGQTSATPRISPDFQFASECTALLCATASVSGIIFTNILIVECSTRMPLHSAGGMAACSILNSSGSKIPLKMSCHFLNG